MKYFHNAQDFELAEQDSPTPPLSKRRCGNRTPGFTLIEFTIVAAIMGTLAALALPNYLAFRNRGWVAAAISDMKNIETALYGYYAEHGEFPESLSTVRLENLRDPWKNPYDYVPINEGNRNNVRKDRSVHPINTDFDLYSRGRDGRSVKPLTAQSSQDDVIRARNGDYYGLVTNYH